MQFADQVREVEAEYQRLKGQVGAGVLTEAECKAKLAARMIQDEQGRWWTIGYETGQWYYHDGEKWVGPAVPLVAGQPRQETPPVPTPRVTKPMWIGGGVGALVLLVVLVLAVTQLGGLSRSPGLTPTPPPTVAQPAKTFVLPMATPTPLRTATLAPPTATSVPPATTLVSPTATSIPPIATRVTPTATPVPPTATNVPPTATPVPPTATRSLPTPSPRPDSYGVPLLVAPANGQEFSEATWAIQLSWETVGDLLADEFYDVYLTWREGSMWVVNHWYRQETRFVFDQEYCGRSDCGRSDNGRYEWNVVVRRGQRPDAMQLSPISEQWFFLWRSRPPPMPTKPLPPPPPTPTPTKPPPPTPHQ